MPEEKGIATIEQEHQGLQTVRLDVNEVANAIENARILAALVERRFVEGHHFMHIPGTSKKQRPHLCDPGAALITTGFHLRPGPYRVLESKDDDEGHYSLALECTYIHIPSGLEITAGVGSATTHEVKYAYRWLKYGDIPAGVDRDMLPVRTNQDGVKTYRVDNPDIGDLYNTIWKMAAKRAEGDAVLKLPGCSELFAGYRIESPRGQRGEVKEEKAVKSRNKGIVRPEHTEERGTEVISPAVLNRINELSMGKMDDQTDRRYAWLDAHFGRIYVSTTAEAQAYLAWLEAGLPDWQGHGPQSTAEVVGMERDSRDLFTG